MTDLEVLKEAVIKGDQNTAKDLTELVSMMLKGAGFNVIDLGTDVAPEKFLEAAKEMMGA